MMLVYPKRNVQKKVEVTYGNEERGQDYNDESGRQWCLQINDIWLLTVCPNSLFTQLQLWCHLHKQITRLTLKWRGKGKS